jgi:long-chain acyl-CoA synthetase
MLTAAAEVKLESCPELGYTTEDIPYPRGEVLVRSPAMASGYLDAELT